MVYNGHNSSFSNEQIYRDTAFNRRADLSRETTARYFAHSIPTSYGNNYSTSYSSSDEHPTYRRSRPRTVVIERNNNHFGRPFRRTPSVTADTFVYIFFAIIASLFLAVAVPPLAPIAAIFIVVLVPTAGIILISSLFASAIC